MMYDGSLERPAYTAWSVFATSPGAAAPPLMWSGSGSAAANSRPIVLAEARASGSGGSRAHHHIPRPNAPLCPPQEGQMHNGYISDKLAAGAPPSSTPS